MEDILILITLIFAAINLICFSILYYLYRGIKKSNDKNNEEILYKKFSKVAMYSVILGIILCILSLINIIMRFL